MAGYNRVIIVGNLTRDPDYKQLASGQAVCRLSIATNRQFKNRQTGGMVQEVCYIDVDVWGAQAESCRQYLQKGRSILVEGRLKYDTWEANGQTRGKHSIVADQVKFLGASSAAEDVADDEAATTPFTGGMRAKESVSGTNAAQHVEKELFEQIDRLKAKSTAKTSKKQVQQEAEVFAEGGEIDFKDQPPFEDELPF